MYNTIQINNYYENSYSNNFLNDIDYEILIVEQEEGKPFNRGKILNVGAVYSKNSALAKGFLDPLAAARRANRHCQRNSHSNRG